MGLQTAPCPPSHRGAWRDGAGQAFPASCVKGRSRTLRTIADGHIVRRFVRGAILLLKGAKGFWVWTMGPPVARAEDAWAMLKQQRTSRVRLTVMLARAGRRVFAFRRLEAHGIGSGWGGAKVTGCDRFSPQGGCMENADGR